MSEKETSPTIDNTQVPSTSEVKKEVKNITNRTNELARPHRCDMRLEELVSGAWKTFSPRVTFKLFKIYRACLKSEIGQEPTEPIQYMTDEMYGQYKRMYERGRMRGKFFDSPDSKQPNFVFPELKRPTN
ncbi:hypothetical protein ABK040_015655 [Willaertia magna]